MLIDATVLVPALGDVEIPVSCLEQGRWGRRRATRRDEAFTPARVRVAKNAGVAESMRRRGSHEGDQAAVWREVDAMLGRTSVRLATVAAADANARHAVANRPALRQSRSSRPAGRSPASAVSSLSMDAG